MNETLSREGSANSTLSSFGAGVVAPGAPSKVKGMNAADKTLPARDLVIGVASSRTMKAVLASFAPRAENSHEDFMLQALSSNIFREFLQVAINLLKTITIRLS